MLPSLTPYTFAIFRFIFLSSFHRTPGYKYIESTTSICFLTLYIKLRYHTTYNIQKLEIGIRDWRETLLYLISDSFVQLLLNLSKIIHSFHFIVLIVHVIQCPENSGLRLNLQLKYIQYSNIYLIYLLPQNCWHKCWTKLDYSRHKRFWLNNSIHNQDKY